MILLIRPIKFCETPRKFLRIGNNITNTEIIFEINEILTFKMIKLYYFVRYFKQLLYLEYSIIMCLCTCLLLQDASLYYDNNTGIYYHFDQESQTYQFHSQVDISQYYQQCTAEQGAATQNAGSSMGAVSHSTATAGHDQKKKKNKKNKTESEDVSC